MEFYFAAVMTLKLSSKTMAISTQDKNILKFRVRTAGIDLEEMYRDNPVLLWDHDPEKPIGNGQDLKVKNDKLVGTPAFNSADEFALSRYSMVENGTIRASSAGLIPKTWKRVDGEVWLWESVLKEWSITTFGANRKALTEPDLKLYDESGAEIKLSEHYLNSVIPQIDNSNMDAITLSLTSMGLLKLNEQATTLDVDAAIKNLVTLNETQATQIQTLTKEKKTAEDNLKAEQDKVELSARKALLDEAEMKGKITKEQRKLYEAEGEGSLKLSLEQVKGFVGTLPDGPSVESQINQQNLIAGGEELVKLSFAEADAQGKLPLIKEKYPEHFKALWKAEFGEDYKG